MQPPPDTAWFVKAGRFLNVLDAELNVLSPVKVQAWVATIAAGATQISAFVIGHADMIQQGSSILWAGLAHLTHQVDKNNQAKNTRLAAAPEDPNVRP